MPICSSLFVSLRFPRRYPALALKNIEVNFMFLARLFVSLRSPLRYPALALKNIEVNFMFLARLFVSLIKSLIFAMAMQYRGNGNLYAFPATLRM